MVLGRCRRRQEKRDRECAEESTHDFTSGSGIAHRAESPAS
jgi:hypothetical protein